MAIEPIERQQKLILVYEKFEKDVDEIWKKMVYEYGHNIEPNKIAREAMVDLAFAIDNKNREKLKSL